MARSAQLQRLDRRLKAIPKRVKEDTIPSLLKGGNELADTMRRLAPADEGDLRDSITITGPGQSTPPYSQPGGETVVPENAVKITVGDQDVRYPHLVEYGTTKAAAQPFFWPAFRLLQKRLQNRVKRSISKAVKEGWK